MTGEPACARGPRHILALRRRLVDERGQAMVETALVLPMLVLLVVGMLEFGRAINYWLDVNHLASEGARLASVDNNPTGGLASYLANQATSSELKSGGTSSVPDALNVCVSIGGDGSVGQAVTVKVTSKYHWLPLAKLFGGSSWADSRIVGSATMRLEQQADAIRAVAACT